MARPRSFDRDAALQQAMLAFWENGYEQTSINHLTKAMGIAPPSLYAAFGDKRRLFEEAVTRYQNTPGMIVADELAAPSAREGVQAMLYAAARHHTDDSHPRGCLIATEPSLTRDRQTSGDAIRERVQHGVDAGELPASTDVDALATFYGVVVGGMSAYARDGATRDELLAIADTAMAAWPGGRGRKRVNKRAAA